MRLKATLASALTLILAAPAAAFGDTPVEPIDGAEQLFGEVLGLVTEQYVDSELGEDEVWTLALNGAMDGLSELNGPGSNQLLSPTKLKSLRAGIKGQLSGIGVVIRSVERLVIVREVIDGGPAKEAGLVAGDRILRVGDTELAGMDESQVAMLIRGPQGTTVDLHLQRGTDEWSKPITRRMLKLPSVISGTLEDGVAYIKIRSFAEPTVPALDRALEAAQTARGIVVDLRGCPGGLLSVSIDVAARFLEAGQRILSTKGRNGEEKVYAAEKTRFELDAPIAVLVDRHTASSAEIVAAAISENRSSALVGERTFGKGTVESVIELSNGWALKLSVARFYSPSGHNWQGRGIQPDFAVPPGDDRQVVYSMQPQLDLERDPQLKAAVSVIELLQPKS